MRRLLFTLFATLILHSLCTIAYAATILLPKTGQTTCYDASGASIACAGTGQDGELQMGVAWPNPRFSDNSDQTVTDNLTGLIWTKDANLPATHNPIVDAVGIPIGTGATWQQALDYVKALNTENYLGHNDWRLPNINELASLVNKGESNQAAWLNGQGFANVQSVLCYWSGSSRLTVMNNSTWATAT